MTGKELVIGCGKNKRKAMLKDHKWEDVTTLDIDESKKPDVVWDLHNIPLPFEDETFEGIHAYEVLEHVGRQGDYSFFFSQFNDFWRLLKPKGRMYISFPRYDSVWAWGDPGHSRVLTDATFVFLSQKQYEEQVGVTAMADYRSIYHGNFEVVTSMTDDETIFMILEAIK